jgi:hypothetical protein
VIQMPGNETAAAHGEQPAGGPLQIGLVSSAADCGARFEVCSSLRVEPGNGAELSFLRRLTI